MLKTMHENGTNASTCDFQYMETTILYVHEETNVPGVRKNCSGDLFTYVNSIAITKSIISIINDSPTYISTMVTYFQYVL